MEGKKNLVQGQGSSDQGQKQVFLVFGYGSRPETAERLSDDRCATDSPSYHRVILKRNAEDRGKLIRELRVKNKFLRDMVQNQEDILEDLREEEEQEAEAVARNPTPSSRFNRAAWRRN
ncbi:hypothetical protein Bbelb_235930 [Branchiostoma belcheri]|nr:hypothetical protein Bbelb_235930 [Branchiostoma belcheri]